MGDGPGAAGVPHHSGLDNAQVAAEVVAGEEQAASERVGARGVVDDLVGAQADVDGERRGRTRQRTAPETSRAERREDHLISTLKRYVEGLGGELEVFAVFDDKRVKLKGV